jgi:hypothetical protein
MELTLIQLLSSVSLPVSKNDTIYLDDANEVEVSRRRQSGSGNKPQSRRASAPNPPGAGNSSRDLGSSGGGTGGSGYGSGSGSSFPTGGSGRPGKIRLPIWAVILLVIIYVAIKLFSGGKGTELPVTDQQPIYDQPTQEPAVLPTARPQPTRKPVASTGSGQRWLVMLYQDADDKVLERDIMMDLNEVELIGSSDQVDIVSQIDRYAGGYAGEGDWSTTRRYHLEQDDDLLNLNSPMIDDLGELNMAKGDTLVDFVTWAVDAYPADKYVLILSDHGMGWPGGWSDSATRTKDNSSAPIAYAIGDNIFLMELDQALATIQSQTGIGKMEMIGLDACLMSDLAVYSALEPYANYAVASQETEPGIGWAYASFLRNLEENPGVDGAQLGTWIVDSYVKDDQRLIDDRARADFVGQGSPMSSLFGSGNVMSAAQLQAQLERDVTLTALDLSQVSTINQKLNELAFALQSEKQNVVAKARNYTQSYTSVWGSDVPPSYLDLGNLTQLLVNENISESTIVLADQLEGAIRSAVVAEKHGQRKPGSTGISIYFPNSSLYSNDVAGAVSYTEVAQRFAEVSLWDDYLAFHYTKRPFTLQDVLAVTPLKSEPILQPGGGKIKISKLALSSTTASPGNPVKLSATISGNNIGYVYLFVGYVDSSRQFMLPLDADYLQSSDTREVNGIYYPVWPDGESFKISLSWEPTVFEVSDGSNSLPVLLSPQSYGADPANAVYTIDGLYTFADRNEQKHARLYFSGSQLTQVFGFTDYAGVGAPAEITPQTGDTFAVQQNWVTLDKNGKPSGSSLQYGETLTFGSSMFTWEEVYAAPGEYQLGIIVEDMDGNQTQSAASITVE